MRQLFTAFLFFFSFPLFSQQAFETNLTIKETYISNPESAISLFENALNTNDVMQSVSLFPIRYSFSKIKLIDNVKRLGIIDNSMYPYFSGFEGMLPYYIISEFSRSYLIIKLRNLNALYPEFDLTNPIKKIEELSDFTNKIQIANSKKIKITVLGKNKYSGGSLYQYSEAYVFECSIVCEEILISEEAFFRVIKIDGDWRLEAISL